MCHIHTVPSTVWVINVYSLQFKRLWFSVPSENCPCSFTHRWMMGGEDFLGGEITSHTHRDTHWDAFRMKATQDHMWGTPQQLQQRKPLGKKREQEMLYLVSFCSETSWGGWGGGGLVLYVLAGLTGLSHDPLHNPPQTHSHTPSRQSPRGPKEHHSQGQFHMRAGGEITYRRTCIPLDVDFGSFFS